jgi:hypothetical protein
MTAKGAVLAKDAAIAATVLGRNESVLVGDRGDFLRATDLFLTSESRIVPT